MTFSSHFSGHLDPHILNYELSVGCLLIRSKLQEAIGILQVGHTFSVFLLLFQSFVVVQSLSCIRLFVTSWTAACQAALSSTIFWSLLKFMSIELVMLSNHLILYCPLITLPSLSQHQSLPKSQLFTSGGQSIGVSASALVLSMNIEG